MLKIFNNVCHEQCTLCLTDIVSDLSLLILPCLTYSKFLDKVCHEQCTLCLTVFVSNCVLQSCLTWPPPSPPELTKWFYLSLYNPITHIVHEQDTLRLTGVGIWLLTKSIKIAFVSFQTFILAMNNAPSRSNVCYNVC